MTPTETFVAQARLTVKAADSVVVLLPAIGAVMVECCKEEVGVNFKVQCAPGRILRQSEAF